MSKKEEQKQEEQKLNAEQESKKEEQSKSSEEVTPEKETTSGETSEDQPAEVTSKKEKEVEPKKAPEISSEEKTGEQEAAEKAITSETTETSESEVKSDDNDKPAVEEATVSSEPQTESKEVEEGTASSEPQKESEKDEEATVETESEEAAHHIAKNIKPLEQFDWENYEEGEEEYSSSKRQELEELYTENLSTIEKRQIVSGKVVQITDKDVVLNIGFKSDGLVQRSEFKNKPDLQVGDEVDVLVEETEDKEGQLVLSYKKARAEKAWETIVNAHENDEILEGYIRDRTKGGMVVDLLGLEAFMPGSQIDIKPIKDYDAFVGQKMDVKVVKLNHAFRNIVVSHKAIIESDLEAQKADILSKLEKGQVLEGVVKNLTSFGVFVDLGGLDGLIHITDVSWGRINHPEEILELGQKINVVVLDYDEEKKRISLGMKQLTPHPWETLPEDIVEGSKVKGKVVNIEDYGAFIEIHPGVEGLIHVSEMSWSQHLKSPQEYVQLGDEVEAVVLSIDREERKLSLGMKQLKEDPWDKVEEKYPVGSKHNARVRSITNFGLFMELEEGIDGLVHISDLSWTKKFNHPNEFTSVGEELEVVVLEIDKDNRRLSLGVKQLEEDPWDTFESIFIPNSIHEGTIKSVENAGAIVIMPYGVEAFAPSKHLMKKDKTKVQPEETLEFKVIEFDKDNRKIIISHTDIWKEEERAQKTKERAEKEKQDVETKKELKKVKSKVEKSTIGGESSVLADLKKKMEDEEKKRQKEAMAKMDAKLKEKGEGEDVSATGEEEKTVTEDKKEAEEKKTAKKTTKKASAKKEETGETEKESASKTTKSTKAATKSKADKAEDKSSASKAESEKVAEPKEEEEAKTAKSKAETKKKAASKKEEEPEAEAKETKKSTKKSTTKASAKKDEEEESSKKSSKSKKEEKSNA